MMAVGNAARKAQAVSVQRAAFAMKEVHTAGLFHDAAGGRLRRVGKNGAKLSVRYKLHGGSANPSAIVEAVGPWQILNNPAKAHLIKSKMRKAVSFNGVARRSVQHPGHKGKFTWQKAQPAAGIAGTKELNKHMVTAVQQAFKG